MICAETGGLPWWLWRWRVYLPCRRPRFNSWSGRSSGEGNGYPLQCSCLKNSKGRGAWQATVHGVPKSQTWLSDFHFHPVSFSSSRIISFPFLFVLFFVLVSSVFIQLFFISYRRFIIVIGKRVNLIQAVRVNLILLQSVELDRCVLSQDYLEFTIKMNK